MRRFLFVTLFASLLIPSVAKANTHDMRNTCARFAVKELTTKQTLRKLNLSIPKKEGDPWYRDTKRKVEYFCKVYVGGL